MPEQPKILTRLKRQLREQGMTSPKVQKIAVSALQKAGNLKADGTATAKGIRNQRNEQVQPQPQEAVEH